MVPSVGLSLPATTTSPIDDLGCLAVTSPSLFFPGYFGQSTAPLGWRTGRRLADRRRFMASAYPSTHYYWPSDGDSLTASQPAPVAPQQPRGYLRPLTHHSSRPCFARRLNSGVRAAKMHLRKISAVLSIIAVVAIALLAYELNRDFAHNDCGLSENDARNRILKELERRNWDASGLSLPTAVGTCSYVYDYRSGDKHFSFSVLSTWGQGIKIDWYDYSQDSQPQP